MKRTIDIPLEKKVEDAYARHPGQAMRRPKGEKVFRPVCTFVDGTQTGLSFEEKCLEIDRQLKERTKKTYIQTLVSEYDLFYQDDRRIGHRRWIHPATRRDGDEDWVRL